MKKLNFILTFLLIIACVCLVGCTKKYTVTFETNCDQTVAAQEVKENEKVIKPEELTKEGYLFLGWYNGEVEYKFEEPVTSNLTLTAKWEEIKFTVKFETGTDQKIDSQSVKQNGNATKPADPVREGYKFLGWFIGDAEYTFAEAVTKDITLTAKWEEVKYTVIFETGCDLTVEAQIVKENEKATKPQDLTREGYKFLGWFNGDVEYTFEEAVTANITLTAKWEEIKKYTVTFKANGEVVATVEVEEGKDATAPTPPTIEGQSFVKWEGSYTNVIADTEVVAVYEAAKFLVQFKVDGKVYVASQYVEYGKACETPEDPTKEGYKFVGWDKDFSSVKSHLIINAKFEAEEYAIEYYNGDTKLSLEPSKYTIESTVELPSFSLTDYYFFGWYDNNSYEGEALTQIEPGKSGLIKLYALNVKVDINGGAECWTTEFKAGHDAGKGIDEISNLPEIFEMDFFLYLSDNNLLTSDQINSTCQATTWAVFSGINPLHNGDPKRIWNDTSSNVSGGADGYVSVFLYDTIELNDDKTVKSVTGGFLGTEPYKTKYRGVLNHLVALYQYKVENNNYTDLTANTKASRALMGFVIDGYFYGTQGAASGYFKALRNVIPGIDFSYKISGDSCEKITYEKALPTPIKDGYVFVGWCLDKEGTKPLETNKPTNLCTIYAKWEEASKRNW